MIVTKGAQLDQFDWPRTFRSQVSIYNRDAAPFVKKTNQSKKKIKRETANL